MSSEHACGRKLRTSNGVIINPQNFNQMVTNFLRLDGIRRDEIKELARIQNQTGIKHNRMGLEKTEVS